MLIVGLDCAGKTQLLYKLKVGDLVSTIPTIGFNCETVTYKNVTFTAFDLGGQDKIRTLWRYYFINTDVVLFMVDSNDPDRFELAAEELSKLVNEPELNSALFAVFANKQDIPSACSVPEVANALGLNLLKNKKWFIQGTSVLNGSGIYEGLD